MSSIFYRALKAQDNLDEMFPKRNHPRYGIATPEKIEMIKLFRKGMRLIDISILLNEPYAKVQCVVSNAGLDRVNRR